MKKEEIKIGGGRYLIYYRFDEETNSASVSLPRSETTDEPGERKKTTAREGDLDTSGSVREEAK